MPDVMRSKEENGQTISEWLVVYQADCRVTGADLQSATASFDQGGAPSIEFTLKGEHAWKMHELTSLLKPKGPKTCQLAIIFDGEIESVPTVQSAISSQGMITGDFSRCIS